MARPLRLFEDGGAYHVVARGNEKAVIFRTTRDFEVYKTILEEKKRIHGPRLYHYVLMPNHIHLLFRSGPAGLSVLMRDVQTKYAKYFRNVHGSVGHVWQGRYFCKQIESDGYLLACGNYIEMNPVRAGLVVDCAAWAHSSYAYYAQGKEDRLVDENPLFSSWALPEKEKRLAYKAFVASTRGGV